MADDRPANDDLAAVVAELRRELSDLKGTALARAGRSPTGDIEPTIRTTPKQDTLLLQGQTLQRADYPVLWQWIVDQSLAPSVFGNGDGSTTFALPDLRGRTLIGAGTLGPDNIAVGALLGSSRVTLSLAQMPAHNHGTAPNHVHWSGTTAPNHNHYFATSNNGGHWGHIDRNALPPDGPVHYNVAVGNVFSGAHTHDGYTAPSGTHDHGYTSESGTHSHTTQGSGSAIDARPPALAVNWLIWC